MPPHSPFCKTCGERFSFIVVKQTAQGTKVKCGNCGKITYRYGRYSAIKKSQYVRKGM